MQSASATVGILQALSVTGAISFSVALPIIMGIAVGAAMPVIISSFGATTDGKRTAFVYLLVDALGALIWAVVFYSVNHFVHFSFMDRTMTTVSIAFVNSLFRVATVAVLFPFIRFLERWYVQSSRRLLMRKIKILLKSVYLMTDLLLILQLLLNRLRQFFVQWHIWHRKSYSFHGTAGYIFAGEI